MNHAPKIQTHGTSASTPTIHAAIVKPMMRRLLSDRSEFGGVDKMRTSGAKALAAVVIVAGPEPYLPT